MTKDPYDEGFEDALFDVNEQIDSYLSKLNQPRDRPTRRVLRRLQQDMENMTP